VAETAVTLRVIGMKKLWEPGFGSFVVRQPYGLRGCGNHGKTH